MRATENEPSHITQGNVFLDIDFPPEKALSLKFKAKILIVILDEVRRKKYRQAQLVKVLDEHQSVVSNLLHGKITTPISKTLHNAGGFSPSHSATFQRQNRTREC